MPGIPDLTLVQIYKRALALLAPEKYLALMLSAAGIVLAGIQLAEPILFGKVVDALSKGEGAFSIIALWAALGLFGIAANVTVAIYSDRLAHRRRLAVLADSFEKAMVLPQSYHAARGSGTVIRTLVSGCSSLFWLWLGAMRDQLTALFGIILLVPTALSMDTRMAGILACTAIAYTVMNVYVCLLYTSRSWSRRRRWYRPCRSHDRSCRNPARTGWQKTKRPTNENGGPRGCKSEYRSR